MDGGHDIEAAMNPSLHDEEEDENSFYIKINEKDTPVDLFKSPEVEVIHIYRVKALWEFNVFVVQFVMDDYKWCIRLRTRQLFSLHVALQSTLKLRLMFPFPMELLSRRSPLEAIQEKPIVEAYLRRLLLEEHILKNPKVLQLLQLGGTRFSRIYGESLAEGNVKAVLVPLIPLRRKGFRISADFIAWLIFLLFVVMIPIALYTTLRDAADEIVGRGETEGVIAQIVLTIIVLCVVVPIVYIISRYMIRRHRWLVVKPTSIAFFPTRESTEPSDVILFSQDFNVSRSRLLDRGIRWMQHGIHIQTPTQVVEIDAGSEVRVQEILDAIEQGLENCPWTAKHRYQSFAPMRPAVEANTLNVVRHLVDGKDTFGNMLQCLRQAQREVFIAGWWVSPDHHLERPTDECPDSKLDIVLRTLANSGVKIYITIYKESQLFLPNASLYSKHRFRELHENIHVIRHPTFVLIPQYWSHHEKLVIIDQHIAYIGGLDLCLGRYDIPSHPLVDESGATFPGKDYSNPRVKDFYEVDNPWVDMIDRKKVPRMPWHDVACRITGPAATDAARHFIQRWNFMLSEKYTRFCGNRRATSLPPIMPADRSYFSRRSSPSTSIRRSSRRSRWKGVSETTGACHCQVLRSLSKWSCGIPVEASIHEAYIDAIHRSKHFIYLENQFFVSGFDGDSTVTNRIVDALYQRIILAHERSECFRVMVIMPLLPAFEGAVSSKDSSSLRAVMHWQYSCISHGESSLMARLGQKVDDPAQYIAFFGLRSYGKLGNEFVTEQIYVHSKLMIVDDRICLIGSANINDRSLRGDRDSEVAVLIEDSEFIQGEMNGVKVSVGRFSHAFRMQLMSEHLGEPCELDPIISSTWNDRIRQTAHQNTQIFEQVFHCLPSNRMTDLQDQIVSASSENAISEHQRYQCGQGWVSHEELGWMTDSGVPVEDFVPNEDWKIDFSIGKCDSEGWCYSWKRIQRVRHRRWILRKEMEMLNHVFRRQSSFVAPRDDSTDQNSLHQVKGHLVEFPLEFLCNVDIKPKFLPKSIFL